VQRRLNCRLAIPSPHTAASEASGNNFAVINNEAIARLQQIWQVANAAIDQLLHVTRFHYQEPGSISWNRWPQRDAVGWKLEIEKVGAH
jgi:hypothetical protein